MFGNYELSRKTLLSTESHLAFVANMLETHSTLTQKLLEDLDLPILKHLIQQRQLEAAANKHKKMNQLSLNTSKNGIDNIISTIGAPAVMYDPLIIMMGVGEYEKNVMDNLDRVKDDYDNVIDTFVKKWKYKVFYGLNDHDQNKSKTETTTETTTATTLVYSNDINEINECRDYKLKWNDNEIDSFVEEARHRIIKNRHDGFIFAIGSHGDSEKVMYDSTGEEYQLDQIFSKFSPEGSAFCKKYQEKEQESNHLFKIPKIFLLDMCRGNMKAKVTNVETTKTTTLVATRVTGSPATLAPATLAPPAPNGTQNIATTPNIASQTALIARAEEKHGTNRTNGKNEQAKACADKKETGVKMRRVNKDEAGKLVAQMANFSKVYANVEGFSVIDGVFSRMVCDVFNDREFVKKHLWSQMIIKIREKTKMEATTLCNLDNVTQLVEIEDTLERPVAFGSKYLSIKPNLSYIRYTYDRNLVGIKGSDKLYFVLRSNRVNDISEICKFGYDLGKGRTSNVVAAEINKNGKTLRVALKQLLKSEKGNLRAFSNEYRMLVSLNHKNIVKIEDFYIDNRYYYIAMQFCSGGTLRDFINAKQHAKQRMSEIEASSIVKR